MMIFAEEIKKLRTMQKLPQRVLAASLDVDTATYCKIEKGERHARKEQVSILSHVLKVKEDDLMTLWLADKISSVVMEKRELASKAIEIANRMFINIESGNAE